MGIGFKGGLAAFIDGYSQGEQQNYQRARQKSEDDWVKSQRERTVAENKRQDELRDKLASHDNTAPEQVDNFVNAADGAGNVPRAGTGQRRQKTDAETLEDYAGIYQPTDPGKALELRGKAKELTARDYAQKFNQFRAAAADLPVAEQVKQAVGIFNDAPNPGMISNVQVDPVTGAVSFDAFNKATGQRVQRNFQDPQQLISDLHAFVSPESYQAEAAARQAHALKQQETVVLPANSKLVTKTGRAVANGNTTQGLINVGTEDNPQWVQGGSGAGGKGQKPPVEQARGLISDALEKSDIKAKDPAAYARTVGIADHLYATNPSLAPGIAANIATTAAADEASAAPKFVRLRLNPDDGTVSKVYSNPDHEGGRTFNIGRNAASLQQFSELVGAKGMQQAGADILGVLNEPTRKLYLEAAKDPARLKQAQDYIRAKSAPETLEANLAALNNRVQVLSQYTLPKAPQKGGATDAAVKDPGGIYQPAAGTPPAVAQRVRQAEAQRARTAAEQAAAGQTAQAQRMARQQEVAWLTEAEARVMKPSEAADYYRKYQDVLPPAVLRALRSRQ